MSTIFRKVINKLQGVTHQALKYCTIVENQAPDVAQKVQQNVVPIISKVQYNDENLFYQKPRQVWLENLDTIKEKKLGFVTLHPHIFATTPRIDIIHQNVRWQRMYRWVVSIALNIFYKVETHTLYLYLIFLIKIH